MASTVARSDLLDSLQTLSDRLGSVPTRADMNADGPYSQTPFYAEFGSWNDALDAAGLSRNHEPDVSDAALCDDLRRVAAACDRLPRMADVDEHGAYHPSTYLERWDSWAEAKRAAGLCPGTRTTRRVGRSALCTALRSLAFEVGHPPTQREMNELGAYSQRPFYRAWDAWGEALHAAGLATRRARGVPRAALLEELQRLAAALGGSPTIAELEEHGAYSVSPYLRAFEDWNAALRAAGLSVNKAHGVREEEVVYGSAWRSQRRRALRRDAWRCQECGLTLRSHRSQWDGEGLHVHHRRKLRRFDDVEAAHELANLVTVCRPCHQAIEGAEG